MMSRIPILLDEKTAAGLVELAKQEYRDPRQQAAVIIRDELERRGLLQTAPTQVTVLPSDNYTQTLRGINATS